MLCFDLKPWMFQCEFGWKQPSGSVRSSESLTFVITAGCSSFPFLALFADYHYYSDLVKLVNLFSGVNPLPCVPCNEENCCVQSEHPLAMKTLDSLAGIQLVGRTGYPSLSLAVFFISNTQRKNAKHRKQNHALVLEHKCKVLGRVRKQPSASCAPFLHKCASLFPLLTANAVDTRWWRVNCEVHCIFTCFTFLGTGSCAVWSKAACTGFGPWSVFASVLRWQ